MEPTRRALPVPKPRPLAALAVAAALAAAAPAAAQAPAAGRPVVASLDPGMPAEVEDAIPLAPGRRELLLPLRIDHEKDGDDRWLVEPMMQWGVVPRLQAAVSVPVIIGSGDRTNSGTLRGELMYQLVDEGALWPAVSVLGRLDLPTGNNADGIDPTIKLLATKTLGARPGSNEVHLNWAYRRNASPRAVERDDTWRLVVGWSTLLTDRTALVADVRRGHDREGSGRLGWVYEVGVRQAWTSGTTIAFGVGAGDGPDQPSWRISGGLQTAF